MPIRATWKSLVGLLAMAGGAISQVGSIHGLPPSVASLLALSGALIVGGERVADAIDNKTSLTAKIAGVDQAVQSAVVPAVQAAVTQAPVDIAALEADAKAAVAYAQGLVDKASAARAAANPSTSQSVA